MRLAIREAREWNVRDVNKRKSHSRPLAKGPNNNPEDGKLAGRTYEKRAHSSPHTQERSSGKALLKRLTFERPGSCVLLSV